MAVDSSAGAGYAPGDLHPHEEKQHANLEGDRKYNLHATHAKRLYLNVLDALGYLGEDIVCYEMTTLGSPQKIKRFLPSHIQ